MTDNNGGYEMGTPEPEAQDPAVGQLKAQGLPAEAITGFVVVLTNEGVWVASSGQEGGAAMPAADKIKIKRVATHQEMLHGAEVIASELSIVLTAHQTAQVVAQHAQQAQQQMAAALEARKVEQMIQQGGPNRQQRRGGLTLPPGL